mgnify:CR=1 FL=1
MNREVILEKISQIVLEIDHVKSGLKDFLETNSIKRSFKMASSENKMIYERWLFGYVMKNKKAISKIKEQLDLIYTEYTDIDDDVGSLLTLLEETLNNLAVKFAKAEEILLRLNTKIPET